MHNRGFQTVNCCTAWLRLSKPFPLCLTLCKLRMPRKQLLVLGFRQWGQVAKQVQQQKAARLIAAKKFHSGAVKASAYKQGGQQTSQSAGQLQKNTAHKQDAPSLPSFAASAIKSQVPSSTGLLQRVLSRLGNARPSRPVQGTSSPPSFAAAPLVGGKQTAQQSDPVRRNPILATAKQVAEQAAKKHAISPATASNPLYRFAKLAATGSRQDGQGAAAGTENKSLSALKNYAALSQQQKPAAQAQLGRSAKKAVDVRALLRYAKLK